MAENVHLGKGKKAVWISGHVSKDREAGRQEHKIGEHSSCRIYLQR